MIETSGALRRTRRNLAVSIARERWLTAALALVAYCVITTAFFFPVVAHVRTTVLYEPSDLTSTARDYWAAEVQGKTPFTLTRDRLEFAPEGQAHAPSLQIANAVQPSFVLLFKRWLGYLGALNLYMLLGFVMTGWVMFLLLSSLRLHPLGAFFGGFVFAFNWWQYEQAFYGHIGLNHLWVFPLTIAALLRARRSDQVHLAVLAGVSIGLAFYVFSYLGLFVSFVAFAFMLVDLYTSGDRVRSLRRSAIVWLSTGVSLVPAYAASKVVRGGFAQSFVFTKEYFSGSRLRDFVIPSAHDPFFGSLVSRSGWPPPHVGEPVVFFGYTTLILGIVGAGLIVTRRLRNAGDVGFASWLGVFLIPLGILMSLPAYWHIAGHRVPLPDGAFTLGTFSNWWKIYTRFAIVAAFGLALVSAVVMSHLRSRRRGMLLTAVLITAAVVEAVPGIPVKSWVAGRQTALNVWLERHPGGIVAHYPMLTYSSPRPIKDAQRWSDYTWTTVSDQPLHGHPLYAIPSLGLDGTRAEAIRLLSLGLSRPLTPRVLRAEGVRFVVVHRDVFAHLGIRHVQPAAGLKRVARLGAADVYTVTAPPANIDRLLTARVSEIEGARGIPQVHIATGAGFYGPESYNGAPSHWMRQDGTLELFAVRSIVPTHYQLVTRGFSNSVPRILTLRLVGGRTLGRTTIDRVDQTYTIGPFRLPQGKSMVELHVEPGPARLGDGDKRSASLYLFQTQILPLAY